MNELEDPEDYELDDQPVRAFTGNLKTDFTGRELLLSSITEKCYHEQIKRVIENGESESVKLEQDFIN